MNHNGVDDLAEFFQIPAPLDHILVQLFANTSTYRAITRYTIGLISGSYLSWIVMSVSSISVKSSAIQPQYNRGSRVDKLA